MFTQDVAQRLLSASEAFPVDFDEAWEWVGYTSKQKAKDKLTSNFEVDVDYIGEFSTVWLKTPQGGRPSEAIFLSVDCFKSFAMMAGTSKGKEVRKYFIDCEKQLKQQISNPQSILTNQLEQIIEQNNKYLQAMETQRQMEVDCPGIIRLRQHQNRKFVDFFDIKTNTLIQLPESFTLREYIWITRGIKISNSDCISLGMHLAPSIRTLKFATVKEYGDTKIYSKKDIPAIETAIEAWANENKKNNDDYISWLGFQSMRDSMP